MRLDGSKDGTRKQQMQDDAPLLPPCFAAKTKRGPHHNSTRLGLMRLDSRGKPSRVGGERVTDIVSCRLFGFFL